MYESQRKVASPVRQCVSCLYSLGFGINKIERLTGYNRGASAKWLKRCGQYQTELQAKKRERNAKIGRAAYHTRQKNARFPLALSEFWPTCRVEKAKKPKRDAKEVYREYYHANKARIAERVKAYREANRIKHSARNKLWHERNPHKRAEYARKRRPAARAALKLRRKTDPMFRATLNLRRRLKDFLWERKIQIGQSNRLFGCSPAELKAHLERHFTAGMVWGNYGTQWHIDHIKPCAAFNLLDADEQRACFHFSNLQPMFAVENMRKGSVFAGVRYRRRLAKKESITTAPRTSYQ